MIRTFSSIIESNGKTIRENNLAKEHKFPLGTLVAVNIKIDLRHYGAEMNLSGDCLLYVVSHGRDCDGTPLYGLSDIPVKYPTHLPMWDKQKLLYNNIAYYFHGYLEESLTKKDNAHLCENIQEYFGL